MCAGLPARAVCRRIEYLYRDTACVHMHAHVQVRSACMHVLYPTTGKDKYHDLMDIRLQERTSPRTRIRA